MRKIRSATGSTDSPADGTDVSTKSGPEPDTQKVRPLRSINPATGKVVDEFAPFDEAEIDSRIGRSERAAAANRQTAIDHRAAGLLRIAGILESDRDRWSALLTEEMGKTLAASAAEIDKCALVCRYYAVNAERFLADEIIESDASISRVMHLPLGPVLAVMPWNFPFWQVLRFAAPAIAAGNSVLLKHASNVPRTALALESIVSQAELPDHVLQTLLIGPEQVERVLADPRVQAATVTGSSTAGRSVASIAGQHAKKTVLELGGSDPFIVMPSADLDEAARVGVLSRTQNNGQSCIGAKRFIVHEAVYDAFLERFAKEMELLVVGDPTDESTDVGPLAMERSCERLNDQVATLVHDGARRLIGAYSLDGKGFYYQPGILEAIPRRSDAYYDELFGPVAMMFKATDLRHALEIANDSRHGLGSSIWTTDKRETEQAIAALETGATFVNALVRSDPVLPFGGVRGSGYGRELARDGILEFVNRKTVYIA